MKSFRQKQIATALVATGFGENGELVENFDDVALTLVGTGGSVGFTVQVQVSMQDAKPDFTAAASRTNQWAYAQIKALIDGSAVAGGTGVVFTTAGVQLYELNTNGVKWINFNLSSYTAGTFDGYVKGFAIDEAS